MGFACPLLRSDLEKAESLLLQSRTERQPRKSNSLRFRHLPLRVPHLLGLLIVVAVVEDVTVFVSTLQCIEVQSIAPGSTLANLLCQMSTMEFSEEYNQIKEVDLATLEGTLVLS